jgi:hypothetical protein
VSQLAALGIFLFSIFFVFAKYLFRYRSTDNGQSPHTISSNTSRTSNGNSNGGATAGADQQQGARDALRLELLVCLCFLLTSFLLNDG